MEISLLMSTQILCDKIVDGKLNDVIEVLEKLKCFDMRYILDVEYIGRLYDLLNENRKYSDCREFSIFLDRTRKGSIKEIDQRSFDEHDAELQILLKEESDDIKAILYNKAVFYREIHVLALGVQKPLRVIECEDDLCPVLTVLGQDIDGLHEFSIYIQNIYHNITFDSNVEKSMVKLEAGFIIRRHEILYHLYVINKKIPEIIHKYGLMDNGSLGEKMPIPCTPERNRNTVENKLTKKADNDKKIKCELHTKMEKIGSHKPDRIYFCASVPDGTKIDGIDLSGRIYVYKITEHV